MDNIRRLNFLVGEDFYFLTYGILNALDAFTSNGGAPFKDHRKLSHLVQFISDERLVGVLSRYAERRITNPIDRELLFSTFTRGELHKREVYKLLLALEKRGYVALKKAQRPEALDVLLNRDQLPEGFLGSTEFESERSNANRIRKLVPRLGALTHETFMDRVYTLKGLSVWVV